MAQPQITGFRRACQAIGAVPARIIDWRSAKTRIRCILVCQKKYRCRENRIALTPDAVGILVRNGHDVWVEKDAGKGANLSDHEYSEAGAKIVQSAKEVYQAKVILKVEPLVEEEFRYIKSGTTLISAHEPSRSWKSIILKN
jgi:alanine dehydrogenase